MSDIDDLATLMQRWRLLEDPIPEAARAWITTFLEAYRSQLTTLEEARPFVEELREESCIVPALELERLRSRTVLFYLDSVAQYVDAANELRGLDLRHDLTEIAKEFGLTADDALASVRMALTGFREGPPLELLFPLLGHDRILMRVGAINSHILHGRGLVPIAYGPDGKPFEPMHGTKPPEE